MMIILTNPSRFFQWWHVNSCCQATDESLLDSVPSVSGLLCGMSWRSEESWTRHQILRSQEITMQRFSVDLRSWIIDGFFHDLIWFDMIWYDLMDLRSWNPLKSWNDEPTAVGFQHFQPEIDSPVITCRRDSVESCEFSLLTGVCSWKASNLNLRMKWWCGFHERVMTILALENMSWKSDWWHGICDVTMFRSFPRIQMVYQWWEPMFGETFWEPHLVSDSNTYYANCPFVIINPNPLEKPIIAHQWYHYQPINCHPINRVAIGETTHRSSLKMSPGHPGGFMMLGDRAKQR